MRSRDWTHHDAGDWMIRARPQRDGAAWYGEAKRKADGPFAKHALYEPWHLEIHFEFADTESAVVQKLRREIAH